MFCKQLKSDHVTPSPLSSPKKKRQKTMPNLPLMAIQSPSLLPFAQNQLTEHNDYHDVTRPNDILSDMFDMLSGTNANAAEDRLPKNTGVITHCLKVLWKLLMRPNYYNITVIYSNT